MRKIYLLAVFLILSGCSSQSADDKIPELNIKDNNMEISSPAFQNEQPIPKKYTCEGENINPPLTIKGIPEGTKSLALIVDDPDAPAGDWVHWVVWDINSKVEEINENTIPQGSTQGTTDFGDNKYGGPCPPPGSPHNYNFRIFALDTTINLESSAGKGELTKAMEGHILDQGILAGTYQR